MSWDITLVDKDTGKVIEFDKPHNIRGGTYIVGGTTLAWLNVTYNYHDIFTKVFGKKGIRILENKTAKESIPILEKAIQKLKNNVSRDYWKPTEGNVKKALKGLLRLAKKAPSAIWRIE